MTISPRDTRASGDSQKSDRVSNSFQWCAEKKIYKLCAEPFLAMNWLGSCTGVPYPIGGLTHKILFIFQIFTYNTANTGITHIAFNLNFNISGMFIEDLRVMGSLRLSFANRGLQMAFPHKARSGVSLPVKARAHVQSNMRIYFLV